MFSWGPSGPPGGGGKRFCRKPYLIGEMLPASLSPYMSRRGASLEAAVTLTSTWNCRLTRVSNETAPESRSSRITRFTWWRPRDQFHFQRLSPHPELGKDFHPRLHDGTFGVQPRTPCIVRIAGPRDRPEREYWTEASNQVVRADGAEWKRSSFPTTSPQRNFKQLWTNIIRS